MILNFVDKVGEWNPQLFRELKGRLKTFNVTIALVSSLLLQLVIILCQLGQLPDDRYPVSGSYCLFPHDDYTAGYCPLNQINWQLWWQDHWKYTFFSLTVIFVFTLLIAGTFLLISDLAKEEHRGTLNFIRLSPQSETSILTGKLLGVPSLIYLFILTAIPLHLWAGHAAGIATSSIFSYYAILTASGTLFYSAALFFGLISRFFSSFQPWLGSSIVLFFLFITMMMASSYESYSNNPAAWFRLLSPWDMIHYLFPNLLRNTYRDSPLATLQFFYLPIGANLATLVGFHIVNYGICTYGIWQGMKRCFRNPNATILNKKQSYLFVALFQVMLLGLTMQNFPNRLEESTIFLVLFNFVIALVLIAILSPHRQSIQDWARYRHQNVSHSPSDKPSSLWQDLIWGERSPAIIAIAINLVISTTPILVWIIFGASNQDFSNFDKPKAILAVAMSGSLMMIYATIAQMILLMKTHKRSFLAIGTVGTAILLPPIILQFLSISPSQTPAVWLFSTFPWAALEYSQTITIFKAFVAELTALTLLNFRLVKQVKLAGESATKALLVGR